ncbi:MAG: hypothetical protein JEZ02_09935 [Desulfatibacillum sp.]|nr:hypothetical protein [Desulfatibacillum sp.]
MEEDRLEKDMTDEEWENRKLCSDGACIGVIGPDGRCKECGKPYGGNLDTEGAFSGQEDLEDEPIQEDEEAADGYQDSPDESDDSSLPDEEWENRKLCSDGACIGVIGPDGHCKECGKPYQD